MLRQLITSKTRLRLLLKFFVRSENEAYLRQLAKEFNDSANAVRVELLRLTSEELLLTRDAGNTIMYRANKDHEYFEDIQRLVWRFTKWEEMKEICESPAVKQIYLGEFNEEKSFEYIVVYDMDQAGTGHMIFPKPGAPISMMSAEQFEEQKKSRTSCFKIWDYSYLSQLTK